MCWIIRFSQVPELEIPHSFWLEDVKLHVSLWLESSFSFFLGSHLNCCIKTSFQDLNPVRSQEPADIILGGIFIHLSSTLQGEEVFGLGRFFSQGGLWGEEVFGLGRISYCGCRETGYL